MTRVLLVGLATDGPSNIVYEASNQTNFNSMFGGNYIQRQFISPTATGVTLDYQPYSIPDNKINSIRDYLYAPTLSGATYYVFGSVGQAATGNYVLDLFYTPYLGKQDLVYMGNSYYNQVGSNPYVLRLGGTYASLSTLDGWIFNSLYAGQKYNKLSLSYNGSSLTVTGLEPQYPTRNYYGTIPQIVYNLTNDAALGLCPIQVIQSQPTLASFTGTVTGGADGNYLESDIDSFFDAVDIPTDCTHIYFATPLSSGFISSVENYYTSVGVQPRMLLLPAPALTTPVTSWINTMAGTLPDRHNMIATVTQNALVTMNGQQVERYGAELLAIALDNFKSFNATNCPLIADTFYPTITGPDLDALVAAGFMPIIRHIRNDISIYEGCTTATEQSFVYSSTIAQIIATGYTYCYNYLGKVLDEGQHPEIEQGIANLIAGIDFFQLDKVTVNVVFDTMDVTVQGILPWEILQISFQIKNR